MSAPFQAQLKLLVPDANSILADSKDFPVPDRPVGTSDSAFVTLVRSQLSKLEIEFENASESLKEIEYNHNQWMILRTNMTGSERTADNDEYDTFVKAVPYPTIQNNLKRYVNKLKTQRSALEALLPDPAAPHSLAHLPQMQLPKFSGKCADFPAFFEQFSAAVGNLSIAGSVKLSYLRSCLSDTALSLIDSLPLTDDSYSQAVNLLKAKYNDPDEISRALHQSLKNLPNVRTGEHFCSDLSKLIDILEGLVIRFRTAGADPNTVHIQLEIEHKLPNFVLEEVFKVKSTMVGHWTLDDLKDVLKAILKRKEEIQSIHPHQPKSSQKPNFPHSSPRQNQSPQNPNQSQSSLTFHTQSQAPGKNSPKPN